MSKWMDLTWKAVCNKCSIDIYELATGEAVWLCKICSESREVLKKTNMWTHLAAGDHSEPASRPGRPLFGSLPSRLAINSK